MSKQSTGRAMSQLMGAMGSMMAYSCSCSAVLCCSLWMLWLWTADRSRSQVHEVRRTDANASRARIFV